MQTQHQQLHTHEKILRYELHEKRKMLTELKQELEYCREKWERARQKNSESEVEWRKLRKEFASRKKQPMDVLNNSGESGFSDERDDSCEDDDGTSKDTGQLDPGIDELPSLHAHSGVIRTSSPLGTSFPQPHTLLSSSGICEANRSGSSFGQTELLLHEPILSGTTIMPASPTSEHAELLNHSEPELILDLEAESLPNSECSGSESSEHQNTYHIELQSHPSSMCFDSLQPNTKEEDASGCRIDPPVHRDCSTVSLIALLKQQLSFFSRNLDYITAGMDDISGHNLQALESIFSLPPIQIPQPLNDNITKQDYFQSFYCCEQGDLLDFSSSPPSTSMSVTPDLPSDNTGDYDCSAFKSDHGVMAGETESLGQNSTQNYSLSENKTSKETNDTTQCSADGSTALQEPNVENNSCNEQNSCDDSRSSEELGAVQCNEDNLKVSRTPEEIAEARAARLKRLEEQCQQLYNKVTRTTYRSTALCNRLEELHEQYRSSDSPSGARTDSESNIPAPPPFPHVLHARRIPTTPVLTQRNNSEELLASTSTTSSPFPHTICSRQSPTGTQQNKINDSRDITETDNIPTHPPFPHNLCLRQIPTSSESTVTQISDTEGEAARIFIPTPPPLPQLIRGRLLPVCSMQSQSNNSESLDSTMQTADETTTQRIHNVMQTQEAMSQEPAIPSSATKDARHTDSNLK
jgi:hypothetical protein